MDSILSSASMLMAAIALIYSFYQKEITDAKEYDLPEHFSDAEPKYDEIKNLTYKKLIPLIIFTGIIFLVYLLPVFKVITQSVYLWCNSTIGKEYAPNHAALMIIEAFLMYLFVIFIGILKELTQILEEIDKLPKPNNT